MRNIVEIKEVFKTIDKEEILSGINLQIAEGEIYGFLGPNGAGKTTLMKCMLSLSTITSGSIEIFGKNLQEHREEILSQIGSIIESPIFYDNCTAKEILEIHAQYMGKNIIAVVIVVAELINCSYYLDEVTFVIELIQIIITINESTHR